MVFSFFWLQPLLISPEGSLILSYWSRVAPMNEAGGAMFIICATLPSPIRGW